MAAVFKDKRTLFLPLASLQLRLFWNLLNKAQIQGKLSLGLKQVLAISVTPQLMFYCNVYDNSIE